MPRHADRQLRHLKDLLVTSRVRIRIPNKIVFYNAIWKDSEHHVVWELCRNRAKTCELPTPMYRCPELLSGSNANRTWHTMVIFPEMVAAPIARQFLGVCHQGGMGAFGNQIQNIG